LDILYFINLLNLYFKSVNLLRISRRQIRFINFNRFYNFKKSMGMVILGCQWCFVHYFSFANSFLC